MKKFTHPYVVGAQVRYRNQGSGFVIDELVVISNIPLDQNDPNFDAAKADELYFAAIDYAKQQGSPYTSISFMC